MEELCNRLKTALNIRRMKPIELAEKMNVNRAVISQYISGKYKPNHDRIYEICKILNVNEAWLLGYDVPMEDKIVEIDKLEFQELIKDWLNNPNVSNEKKKELLIQAMEDLK